MLNKVKIEQLITELLKEFDSNPDREGLKETPKRVAKYWTELLEGAQYTNDQIAQMFNKTFEEEDLQVNTDSLVVEKNIKSFSHCEHHLALMYDLNISIAYIPNGKVIGLSKLARVADMVCKRLQLQERIGEDICDVIKKITGSESVAVIIEGKHACMSARGVKSSNAVTSTATLSGLFKVKADLRNELYMILQRG